MVQSCETPIWSLSKLEPVQPHVYGIFGTGVSTAFSDPVGDAVVFPNSQSRKTRAVCYLKRNSV